MINKTSRMQMWKTGAYKERRAEILLKSRVQWYSGRRGFPAASVLDSPRTSSAFNYDRRQCRGTARFWISRKGVRSVHVRDMYDWLPTPNHFSVWDVKFNVIIETGRDISIKQEQSVIPGDSKVLIWLAYCVCDERGRFGAICSKTVNNSATIQ